MDIMVLFNILILALITSAEISMLIVTSSQTPADENILIECNIEAIIYQVSYKFEFSEPVRILFTFIDLDSNYEDWDEIKSFTSGVFLDFTHNPSVSEKISYYAMQNNNLHLILGINSDLNSFQLFGTNTLSSDLSLKVEAQALYSIVQYFNWTHLALIHDELESHAKIGDYVKEMIEKPKKLVTELAFTNIDDYVTIGERLASSIKKTNSRVIFLVTTPQLAIKIIRAAEDAGMAGSGYVWILSSSAIQNFGETLKNTYSTFSTNIIPKPRTSSKTIRH